MLTLEISHAKWLLSTILDPLDSRFTMTWLRLTYVSSKRPLYLKTDSMFWCFQQCQFSKKAGIEEGGRA